MPNLNAHQAQWLEGLAELHLKVHYVPGKVNIAADVVSHYDQQVKGANGQHTGSYSLGDATVARGV